METKLASYQEPGIRMQLVEITEIINKNYPIKIKEICEGWLIKWSNGKNETTTYQNAKTTIDLYKMTYDYENYEYINAKKISIKKYQVRVNRKVYKTTNILYEAKKYMNSKIYSYLNQIYINFEEKKLE